MNLFTKQVDLQIAKSNLRLPKEKCGGRKSQNLGMNIHTHYYT